MNGIHRGERPMQLLIRLENSCIIIRMSRCPIKWIVTDTPNASTPADGPAWCGLPAFSLFSSYDEPKRTSPPVPVRTSPRFCVSVSIKPQKRILLACETGVTRGFRADLTHRNERPIGFGNHHRHSGVCRDVSTDHLLGADLRRMALCDMTRRTGRHPNPIMFLEFRRNRAKGVVRSKVGNPTLQGP